MQTIITFLCKKLLFTERQNREITKQRGRERERDRLKRNEHERDTETLQAANKAPLNPKLQTPKPKPLNPKPLNPTT